MRRHDTLPQMKPMVPLAQATGTIRYNMTNDYMFRYILQGNQKVLKGLICALLHLHPKKIKTIKITNPINLSENIDGKEFILDINILLNDDTQINLEMQVVNKHNWPERSLSYLCRSFDQLYHGQTYEEALPVYHIGFLDYTLFPEHKEFYAVHKLMNVKSHHIFSDKFTLSVVSLNQIELATEEDKAYGLDYWARLFKAKTWEELKMLAEHNEYLQAAADSVYEANADDVIQQRCRAREEYERHERTIKRDFERLQNAYAAVQEEKSALQDKNQTLNETTIKQQAYIQELEEKLKKANLMNEY